MLTFCRTGPGKVAPCRAFAKVSRVRPGPGAWGGFWCVKGRGRAQGASLARRQRLPTTCLRWCHLYTTAEDVIGLVSTRHGRMYLERECPDGPVNIGGHRQARGARPTGLPGVPSNPVSTVRHGWEPARLCLKYSWELENFVGSRRHRPMSQKPSLPRREECAPHALLVADLQCFWKPCGYQWLGENTLNRPAL
jgi:hypothetical protein